MRGLIFDAETTGPEPEEDRAVQLGFVWIDTDTGECPAGDPITMLVDPEIPIPPEATKVHGIEDADVWKKPTFAEVAPQIVELLSEADFIVSYNGRRFDVPLLLKEAERAGNVALAFALQSAHHIDLWTFVEWHMRHERPRTLSRVCEMYGVDLDPDDAHDAGADCVATGQALAAMVARGNLPMDPIKIASMSAELAERLRGERAEFGLALYRARDGDPEELFFGMGEICGEPLADAHRFDLVGRMGIRRSIEHEDTPDRIKAMLEQYAADRDGWALYGGSLVDDNGRLVMAVGKHARMPIDRVPGSYLRMMLTEFDDLADATRAAIEPLASSEDDYERFGTWMYNDADGRLHIGAGKHAGMLLSDVPGSYLSGMRKWAKRAGVNKEAMGIVGWELGRRMRRNRRRFG